MNLDDIAVGWTSVLLADTTTPRRAIIDTGVSELLSIKLLIAQTTLIITSDLAATNIHAQIPGSTRAHSSGIWYIPCSASYPATRNIFFTINNQRFGVPIADLAWKASDQYPGQCISGVQVSRYEIRMLGI